MNLFSSIISDLEHVVNSPLAGPFLQMAETDGLQVAMADAAKFVRQEIGKDPAATAEAIVARAAGDVWHAVRVKLGPLGFVVDIAANQPQPATLVRETVAAAYAQVTGQPAPLTVAPTLAGGSPQ